MKAFAILLAGLTAVSAQGIVIAAPPAGAHLTAGQSTVVDVIIHDFLSSAVQVAVAIGITPCSPASCPSPSDTLGSLLYSGPYNPQLDPNSHELIISQNFTVTIPSSIAKGPATLGVAHFSLLGASLGPWLETTNISVIIQ